MAAGLQHQNRDNSRQGRGSLVAAMLLAVGMMAAHIIVGAMSGSLALLADAGHTLAAVAAVAIALFASWAESRPASVERTFGYHRIEIAGAMLSALALWFVAAWVLFEGIDRLRSPDALEIDGGPMLAVGIVAVGVNLAASLILRLGARSNGRADDALRHLVADFIGSVGVVVAAALVLLNGWAIADPIVSIGIAAIIAASSWRLMLKVFYALMEGTPEHLDLYSLCADIEDMPGVTVIHDVHAWSIAYDYHVLTAHVVLEPGYLERTDALLARMREIVYEKHQVGHLTIQFEESATQCREEHHLSHLEARAR